MKPSRFLSDLPATGVMWLPWRPEEDQAREVVTAPGPSESLSAHAARTHEKKLDLVGLLNGAKKRRSGQVAAAVAGPARPTSQAHQQPHNANAGNVVSADQLRPGDKVRHHSFGEGTVFSVEGEGDKAVITVIFRSAGIRKLAAQYARLEIVD